MKKSIFLTTAIITTFSLLFTACKKDDPPTPVEEELITTLKLTFTGTGPAIAPFIYKVDNGFGNTGGNVVVDTIVIPANMTFLVGAEVLNEQKNPVEDITEEIVEEGEDHLFLYESSPSSGAGSITYINGAVDAAGNPFNITLNVKSGSAGNGTLTVRLMHKPTNKNGKTPSESGGSTDLEAVFPVRLQ